MVEVAALTCGRDVPSTRFRVRQHVPLLAEAGVRVREYLPAIRRDAPLPLLPPTLSPKYVLPLFAAWQTAKLAAHVPGLAASLRAQVAWLQRQLLPGYLTLEPLLRGPVVFDLDDAVWLARPFGPGSVAKIVRRAAVVVAGNAYLAGWCADHGARDVRIIPTAVDAERFTPRPADEPPGGREGFTVGWTGTAGNLRYLEAIEAPLRRFFERRRDARLLVIADRAPAFAGLVGERTAFLRWEPSVEAEAVRRMDVGVMPLPDDPWTRGKCSYKMLQYMACGVPVVASPVGMNREILERDTVGLPAESGADWYDALEHLYAEREQGRQWGGTGRRVVEQCFSRVVVAEQLRQVFAGMV
jgi:glycosyltransferase involved in cell wall biosynthesis